MEDVVPVSSLIFLQKILGTGEETWEKKFPGIAHLHSSISLGPHTCTGGGVNAMSKGVCCSATVVRMELVLEKNRCK